MELTSSVLAQTLIYTSRWTEGYSWILRICSISVERKKTKIGGLRILLYPVYVYFCLFMIFCDELCSESVRKRGKNIL